MSPTEREHAILRILEQGAAAVTRVVNAYAGKRTQARDLHWLSVQIAKEFAAVTMHTERAKQAAATRQSGDTIDDLMETVIEEVTHYQSYQRLLARTLATGGGESVADRYGYLLLDLDENGLSFNPMMENYRERWPENRKYMADSMAVMSQVDPWSARVIGAAFEGGGAGWHWAMSRLDPTDAFLRGVVSVETGIANDELHHGPEEIRSLVETYPGDAEVDFEGLLELLRAQRYQEMRQRNEQFLHPLGENELAQMEQDLLQDSLEPATLYSSAA